LTYDDAPEPRALAQQYDFVVEEVPMTNTHHATLVELVITNTVPVAVTELAANLRYSASPEKYAMKVRERGPAKKG
jgi:hypothetical protein